MHSQNSHITQPGMFIPIEASRYIQARLRIQFDLNLNYTNTYVECVHKARFGISRMQQLIRVQNLVAVAHHKPECAHFVNCTESAPDVSPRTFNTFFQGLHLCDI